MTVTPIRSVKLPVELVEKLKSMRRPHQGIAGVIEELISLYGKIDRVKSVYEKGITNDEEPL